MYHKKKYLYPSIPLIFSNAKSSPEQSQLINRKSKRRRYWFCLQMNSGPVIKCAVGGAKNSPPPPFFDETTETWLSQWHSYTSPYKAMNARHRFDYAFSRDNKSESKICCQNSHVEANGKSVLATEDGKKWYKRKSP